MPKRDLSQAQKDFILHLSKSGKNQRQIAGMIGCTQSAVSKIIRAGGQNKPSRCGRKKCTTKRQENALKRVAIKNRFSTTTDLANKWGVSINGGPSRSTTYRRLRMMGFRSRIPASKPLLNKRQKKKRLTWARIHATWTEEDWTKVIWSDESKFCINFGDQHPRVWRKPCERYRPECAKRSVKHPASVMVWGCICSRGTGRLCVLKTTVNSAAYLQVLEHQLLPFIEDLFGDEEVLFQHDLAPAHSARCTTTWLRSHNIPVLEWPANSPDLNIIENVWDIMKRRMRNSRPSTTEEMVQVIKDVWMSITPETIHNLVASLPRRIQAVIDAEGDSTKY